MDNPILKILNGADEKAKSLILSLLTGGKNYNADVPRRQDWPSEEDVKLARDSDMTYASPMAGLLTNPQTRVNTITARDQIDADNIADPMRYSMRTFPDAATRDQLYAEWLASQRSSLASLGFDPSRMVFTPKDDMLLSAAGTHYPSTDQIQAHLAVPSAPVHESIHRGLNKVRNSYDLPQDKDRFSSAKVPDKANEENMVRMLMYSNYGPVEEPWNPKLVEKAKEQTKTWDTSIFENNPQYGYDPRAYIEELARQILMKKEPPVKKAR